MNIAKTSVGLSCVILCCLLPGCGSAPGIERAPVSGVVTFDGKPIEKGMIVLIPTGGTKGPSTGAEIKDGAFQIPVASGPVPGPYMVEVTASRVVGRIEVQGVAGVQGGLSGAGTADRLEMYIPAKYNTQTTLKYTVEPGENVETFALVSK